MGETMANTMGVAYAAEGRSKTMVETMVETMGVAYVPVVRGRRPL